MAADPTTPAPATPDPTTPGLRAPDFVLPTTDGQPTRFYGAVGGAPLAVAFGEDDIAVHAADGSGGDPLLAFLDDGGGVRRRFGVDPGTAVVLGPDLRVLGTVDAVDLRPDPGQVADLVARLPQHDDVLVSAQAPVLLVPGVLSADQCRWLIQEWRDGGAEETGVETTVESTRAEVRNVKAKRRRDLVITDHALGGRIAQMVGQVLMPEIRRAFHYRATRFEGFKIGCYDASTADGPAGFFSAHRDDLSPATAHRRFALSLNLSDDHEGGDVRFPEFGPMRYRPPAGGALVFSGSLLHEVTPVTRGRRFVLLSFLWGDDVPSRPAT